MTGGQSRYRKLSFYSRLAVVYVLSLTFGWYVTHPPHDLGRGTILARNFQQTSLPTAPHVTPVVGRPVRLVIPQSGVDLPVDPGYYDASTQSWTLSGYRAQFAMISSLANNITGETFIYGHNNNYVFGALRHVTPSPGAPALLYTDNGRILQYSFQKANSVGPEDTSVLNYQGPPIMVIQTCTGSLNEWRTMYWYNFDKVVQ